MDEREARRAALEAELGEPVTLDALTGEWTIFQRKRGHRHSTDDLLTAWYAATKVPVASRLLDLGTGIGTVGLLALSQYPAATLVAIEAQAISYRFFLENLAANGVAARVTPLHGDLRTTPLPAAAFDLITGSPPYWDVKDGIVPADSQKAHARFELRGDVRDYCTAARACLAPAGSFVFCFPTAQRARALAAAAAADLAVLSYRDVIPRAGLAPLFTLFHCRAASAPAPATTVEPPHLVRDASGTPTAAHLAARALFGHATRL